MHRPVLRRWGRQVCALAFAFALLPSLAFASDAVTDKNVVTTPDTEVFALRVDPTPIPSASEDTLAKFTPPAASHTQLTQKIVTLYKVPPSRAAQIVKTAHEVGAQRQVDPVLLLAVIGVESSFNPQAVSSAGAVGLMQALPRAHPEKISAIKKRGHSVFDIRANLEMGAQIFQEYYKKHRGNRTLALQQYNGSLKDKSRRYSNKVMRVYASLGGR